MYKPKWIGNLPHKNYSSISFWKLICCIFLSVSDACAFAKPLDCRLCWVTTWENPLMKQLTKHTEIQIQIQNHVQSMIKLFNAWSQILFKVSKNVTKGKVLDKIMGLFVSTPYIAMKVCWLIGMYWKDKLGVIVFWKSLCLCNNYIMAECVENCKLVASILENPVFAQYCHDNSLTVIQSVRCMNGISCVQHWTVLTVLPNLKKTNNS